MNAEPPRGAEAGLTLEMTGADDDAGVTWKLWLTAVAAE
jgi:hypothetical protein